VNRPDKWLGEQQTWVHLPGAGGSPSDDGTAGGLTGLVYELLDAHCDTARLASGMDASGGWDAHLDYLRALQRKGREMLAHTRPPTQS
jgi:hypothetical protein